MPEAPTSFVLEERLVTLEGTRRVLLPLDGGEGDAWLVEPPVQAQQQTLKRLEASYLGFFEVWCWC